MNPCGTPNSILHQSLELLFIFTLWNPSDKWLWLNFVALKEKKYPFSVASNKLWLSLSSALDGSINMVPTILLLSRACFHFSILFSKAFCVVCFLPNPVKRGEILDSKKKIHLVEDFSFQYLNGMRKNTNWMVIFFSSAHVLSGT